jgi:myosin heavy subunit
MSKLARVKYGTAQLPSGKKIEVGFRQWYEWLEHPETKSFRVDDGEGYTARKETAKGYWYAYRKVEGKLHKRYIGVSKALTLRRLAEIGELFDIPSRPKLPKPVGNSVDLNEELHKQLGNLEEILQQTQAKLEKALGELGQREGELRNLRSEKHELLMENAELSRKSREKSIESTDILLSKQRETDAIISNHKLQRELGNLQIENEGLKAELSEVRSQLSTILELPDAADLLNQLKSRRKKSKTDLQDVEAILELLPEMPTQESQPQLPDLYAARDKLFEMPSVGGWKFEKGEKRDRFYAFASALIEEASKLNPNYTIIQRLQSDLKQATERCDGYGNQLREKTETIRKLTAKLGQRPF